MNPFFEAALRAASVIRDPLAFAALAVVLLVYFLVVVLGRRIDQHRRRIIYSVLGLFGLFIALALAASTYLKVEGVYRVKVLVLGRDSIPVNNSIVTSSNGGESKRIDGGWEFDIPPQTIPGDRKAAFYASVPSAFVSGKSEILLGRNFFITTTVLLAPDVPSRVHGAVLDRLGRPVAGASVAVEGSGDSATTGPMGDFDLPAHAAEGQVVILRAIYKNMVGTTSAPAGPTSVEIRLHP